MLQYVLTESGRYSVGELAQMAVEGGCLWITVHLPEMEDAEIRELLEPDVVELCREASVFLTIDDRPTLARDLGLHGVRLSRDFFLRNRTYTAASLREELGPEAVIGIETTDATALPSLVAADVDFVTFPAGMGTEERGKFLHALRSGGFEIATVAECNHSLDEALDAIADGCSGVAVGRQITDSHDPVGTMQEFIDTLSALKKS